MLEESYERLRKTEKVDIQDVKAFIRESDLNNDGKIDKKELSVII